MADIDSFAIELFEQSKRYLEKAKLEKDSYGQIAYLNAALLIGFASLEAHIYSIADEFIETGKNISVPELSILSEREYSLTNGEFQLFENKLKMYSLLDRIEFIIKKFGRIKTVKKTLNWWGNFNSGIKLRNKLVHPKEKFSLKIKEVEDSLDGILGLLNFLYLTLYNSQYPAFRRKLDSKLNF